MAVFESAFEVAVAMSRFNVGALANAEILDPFEAGFSIEAGNVWVDVFGEGLEFDEDGTIIAGTVTDIDVYQNEEDLFFITDLAMDAVDFADALASGNTQTFFAALFGDADEFTGGDLADELRAYDGDDIMLGGLGNDSLYGGDGDDEIDGEAGADSMYGEDGDDIYTVDSTGDKVIEAVNQGDDTVYSSVDYTLGANVENLILEGEALKGTGNAVDNYIVGNELDNVIDGKTGADTMEGGEGDDSYYVDNAGDTIVEDVDGGEDTVFANASFDLSTVESEVENLTLTGNAANATGNDEDNVITGTKGANRIDGAGGADEMIGLNGNDTYVVDDEGDVIVEAGKKGGTDTVEASSTYELGDFLENLILEGEEAIDGIGNELNNTITGNDADNMLDGSLGIDTLSGEDGDDILVGGIGNDIYFGGDGSDSFVVGQGKGGKDVIRDFVLSQGDQILLGDVLSGYDSETDDLADFVQLKAGRNGITSLLIDNDGAGKGKAVVVATISGDIGTDVSTLIENGNIDIFSVG